MRNLRAERGLADIVQTLKEVRGLPAISHDGAGGAASLFVGNGVLMSGDWWITAP